MALKAKRAPAPLPVSSVPGTRKEIRMPPFPAVQLVCIWALIAAFIVAGPVLYDAAHYGDAAPAPASSSVLLTESEVVAASAVEAGQLWLAAPQATAAALGLLLPGPLRRRRALAFVALAATAGNHYAYSRVAGIVFVAVAGWNRHIISNFVAICFAGILDVLGFVLLLSSAEDDEDEE